MAETVWPTRCIVCGRPGEVLCEACMRNLPYIDQWMACPRCGAPFGRVQCTECNSFARRSMPRWDLPRGQLPFAQCVHAVRFDDASARIVRGCKDSGEQRLSQFMAFAMACAVPPGWLGADVCVAGIPSTSAAVRRRGFDHVQSLQVHLAGLLGLPAWRLLEVGRVRDQRGLGREQRFANMRGCFRPARPLRLRAPGASKPPVRLVEGEGPQGAGGALPRGSVILADDVYTTGATLMSAAETLLDQGFCEVRCITFARVY